MLNLIRETDNQPLMWCLSHTRQLCRKARWIIRLSPFEFVVRHNRGTQNVVADALSHMFEPGDSPLVFLFCWIFPCCMKILVFISDRMKLSGHLLIIWRLARQYPCIIFLGIFHCNARFDGRSQVCCSAGPYPSNL